jgi:hypothetical protein
MALASAKLFVEEGAYVFITGRKQEQLDEAVKQIGRNVTGVRGDSAKLIPRGKMGQPEELRRLRCFLLPTTPVMSTVWSCSRMVA